MLDDAFHRCLTDLKRYDAPGTTCYQHAEARQPGFKPQVHPIEPPYARDGGMGFPELYTVHQGRVRPRQETHFLCALAALGYPGALEHVRQLLAISERVPQDFTNIVADDLAQMPDTVIAARSVGSMLAEWFRDYWLLRSVDPHDRPTASRARSAFTLVELLVVVAIIVLLAAILLPTENNPSAAMREGNLGDVAGANLLFYDSHVEWVNRNRLVDVGEDMAPGNPCGNGDVMSVLP